MSKKYFAWKDPNCNGINPKWIEMTGREFFCFKRCSENKHRLFVEITDSNVDSQNTIFIEANETLYKMFNREHSQTVRRNQRNQKFNYTVVSMESKINDNSSYTFHDTVPDENINVDADAIKSLQLQELRNALSCLSEKEKWIINIVFFENIDNKSLRKVSALNGIPHKTLDDRLKKIIKKIQEISAQK